MYIISAVFLVFLRGEVVGLVALKIQELIIYQNSMTDQSVSDVFGRLAIQKSH